MRRQVFIYGLGGADIQYRLISYHYIEHDYLDVETIKYWINKIGEYPTVESIYAIDNRYGLKHDARESMMHPSIENCQVFKDLLEREGIRLK